MLVLLAPLSCFCKGEIKLSDLRTPEDSVSYYFGEMIGAQFVQNFENLDSTDLELIIYGIDLALNTDINVTNLPNCIALADMYIEWKDGLLNYNRDINQDIFINQLELILKKKYIVTSTNSFVDKVTNITTQLDEDKNADVSTDSLTLYITNIWGYEMVNAVQESDNPDMFNADFFIDNTAKFINLDNDSRNLFKTSFRIGTEFRVIIKKVTNEGVTMNTDILLAQLEHTIESKDTTIDPDIRQIINQLAINIAVKLEN